MAVDTPDWSARLSAWRINGKNGLAWCRDNAISYDQFKYCQKNCSESGIMESLDSSFRLKLLLLPAIDGQSK